MITKKNYVLSAILICISMIAFSSCKKEINEKKPSLNQGTAKAVVDVNNKKIQFSSVRDSSIAKMTWNTEEKKFSFSMVLKDDNSDMLIEMLVYPVNDAAGTYPLADGFSSDGLSITNVYMNGRQSAKKDIYTPVWLSHDEEVTSSSGIITITAMTENTVKGTFNIILYNYNDDTKKSIKMAVTEGSFDVPLIRE